MLNWWCNLNKLTNDEEKLLLKNRPEDKILSGDFSYIKDLFFNRMPYCNLTDEYNISFDICATNIINKLFERYVTDDTLVITSNCEHDNVKKNIKKCKNWLELDHYNDIRAFNYNKILSESKKYKNVFVYIIGTQISSGEITPQSFFIELKKLFINEKINHTIVLDDVQGMFLVPRDYTIFDYIIGTGHSLVERYDLGMVISKKDSLGEYVYNWGKEYINCLDIYLKRITKMNMFTTVMQEHFSNLLTSNKFSLFDRTAPHIFSMKTTNIKFNQKIYDMFDKYEIRLEGIKTPKPMIRYRAQHFIITPNDLIKGTEVVDEMLKMLINQM